MIGKMLYEFVQELSRFDTDTKLLLLRVLVRAGQSGDANGYLKGKLQRILDESDRPPPPPRPIQVTAREVKR